MKIAEQSQSQHRQQSWRWGHFFIENSVIKLIYSHQVLYIPSTNVKEAWTKIKNKHILKNPLNQALNINMLTGMTWKQEVIEDGLLKSKNGTVGATLSIATVADKIGVITEIYITGIYIIYIYSWCFI